MNIPIIPVNAFINIRMILIIQNSPLLVAESLNSGLLLVAIRLAGWLPCRLLNKLFCISDILLVGNQVRTLFTWIYLIVNYICMKKIDHQLNISLDSTIIWRDTNDRHGWWLKIIKLKLLLFCWYRFVLYKHLSL